MLGASVQDVRWSRGLVTVSGTRHEAAFTVQAPRLLVAVPLGVLQAPAGSAGAIRFAPALEAKRAALAGLASGPVIKIMLRFAEAFWESVHGGAYRDASFFHVADAPVRTFWTQAPVHAPLMVSWTAGPRAERLAAAGSEGAMVQLAVHSLGMLFGSALDVAGQLQGYYTHDWQQDPYARGAYSYVLVGGNQARAQLAEPLERTLFFAGEATDNADEAGTVTGALESGVRAAREIIGS
jgi:monoamine oxidase